MLEKDMGPKASRRQLLFEPFCDVNFVYTADPILFTRQGKLICHKETDTIVDKEVTSRELEDVSRWSHEQVTVVSERRRGPGRPPDRVVEKLVDTNRPDPHTRTDSSVGGSATDSCAAGPMSVKRSAIVSAPSR